MKKILIVSDYIGNIGGIEVYIKNVGDLLMKDDQNYNIEYFWLKMNNFMKKYKSFLLPIVWANIISSIQLQIKLSKYKPDIIRYHSIIRYIGWLPVWLSTFSKSKKIIMYHDLGYFHPYPSKVTHEEQILPLSLSNFIKMYTNLSPSNKNNVAKKILVCFKYIHIKILSTILKKNMDLHLVPSSFMKDILIESWKLDQEKIVVLPHFWPK